MIFSRQQRSALKDKNIDVGSLEARNVAVFCFYISIISQD